MKNGRWVWVEEEKWETLPREFYDMRRSLIYLRLYSRLPDADIKFCVNNNLMPEQGMKPAQLERWLAFHKKRLVLAA
jgi:hypothetical protein